MRPNLSFLLALILPDLSSAFEVKLDDPNPWPPQVYKSAPYLATTPSFRTIKTGATGPGYLFLDPNVRSHGVVTPSIFKDDGELIFQGPSGNPIYNVQKQMLHGEPVMTYYNGSAAPEGYGYGVVHIFDTSYNQIHLVSLDDPERPFWTAGGQQERSYIDLHEAGITEDSTILVAAANITETDLTSVGGFEHGWVIDGLAYELDVETGEVLWRWSSLEHLDKIPVRGSLLNRHGGLTGDGNSRERPWGYFHLNSIHKYRYGGGEIGYLIGSRMFCSIYFVAQDGTILWHLDGQNDATFRHVADNTRFCYQHTPRISSQNSTHIEVYLYNNANWEYNSKGESTGLILSLDLQENTVTLIQEYSLHLSPNSIREIQQADRTKSQGSMQVLDNGNAFLGYGSQALIVEYNPQGEVVMTIQFGLLNGETGSYRAYRSDWEGTPIQPPDVVADTSENKKEVNVYISWNGATDVAKWRIYVGNREDGKQMQSIKTIEKTGFETQITLDAKGKQSFSYIQVEAIVNGKKSKANGGKKSNVVQIVGSHPPSMASSPSFFSTFWILIVGVILVIGLEYTRAWACGRSRRKTYNHINNNDDSERGYRHDGSTGAAEEEALHKLGDDDEEEEEENEVFGGEGDETLVLERYSSLEGRRANFMTD